MAAHDAQVAEFVGDQYFVRAAHTAWDQLSHAEVNPIRCLHNAEQRVSENLQVAEPNLSAETTHSLVLNVHIGLILEQVVLGNAVLCAARGVGSLPCPACRAAQQLVELSAKTVCKSDVREPTRSSLAAIFLLYSCAQHSMLGILQGALGFMLSQSPQHGTAADLRPRLDVDSLTKQFELARHAQAFDVRSAGKGPITYTPPATPGTLGGLLTELRPPAQGLLAERHRVLSNFEGPDGLVVIEDMELFPPPLERTSPLADAGAMAWGLLFLSDLVWLLCGAGQHRAEAVSPEAAFVLLHVQPVLLHACERLLTQPRSGGAHQGGLLGSALLPSAAMVGCQSQLDAMVQSMAAINGTPFHASVMLQGLQLASAADCVPAVQTILRTGWVQVDGMVYTTTALQVACYCGSLAAAETLIAAGASCDLVLNEMDECDGSAPHWAARGGHLPLLQLAVRQPNACLTAQAPQQHIDIPDVWTLALQLGHLRCALWLLLQGPPAPGGIDVYSQAAVAAAQADQVPAVLALHACVGLPAATQHKCVVATLHTGRLDLTKVLLGAGFTFNTPRGASVHQVSLLEAAALTPAMQSAPGCGTELVLKHGAHGRCYAAADKMQPPAVIDTTRYSQEHGHRLVREYRRTGMHGGSASAVQGRNNFIAGHTPATVGRESRQLVDACSHISMQYGSSVQDTQRVFPAGDGTAVQCALCSAHPATRGRDTQAAAHASAHLMRMSLSYGADASQVPSARGGVGPQARSVFGGWSSEALESAIKLLQEHYM